jgi:hypothetical protein
MNEILNNKELATKNQTWALYSCFKKDLRNIGLTKTEASELIENFNKGQKELPIKYLNKIANFKPDSYKIGGNVYEVAKIAEKKISQNNKAAKKTIKVSPLYQYMTSNEVAQELISVLGAEFSIGGIITNDIDKSDKKAYLFLGGGLGFSHIKWDKRNKKVGAIVAESREIKRKVETYYMTLIDQNYLNKLEASGNPIEAHFMQNLSYNTSYNYCIIHYLESLGFKNITATSMLD